MLKSIFWMSVAFVVFCSGSQANEYVIGVEDMDYMPYYSGAGNDFTGFVRDVFDAFSKESGIVFSYSPLPVNRLYKSLMANRIDFKFPDNPNWQKDVKQGKTVYYSDITVNATDGVMVLPENRGKGLANLKKMGTVIGFTPWPYKDRIDSGAMTLSENSNFDGLLKQVITHRIDGAYLNPVVAAYRLDKSLSMPGSLVFDETLPHVENAYQLSTLNHKDVIDALNQFLGKNKELIQTLKDKYGIRDND